MINPLIQFIEWVNRILPPGLTAEELERKRLKYWERVDENIYDRSPKKDKILDFQREGIEWLGLHPRAILADDMGLGKTLQSLASVVGADAFPCLIITQATLRRSWEAQIDRWVGMKSYVMDPAKRMDAIRMQKSIPRPFFITHYEGVRAESLSLKEIEWKSLIIDEATAIKNRKAQRTVAIKNIKAPRITLLTGTPIMNSPLDLWSLLNYLNPKQYSSYWAFEKKYCNPPEAPVWMGDLTFKPLGEVKVGDEVIGWHKSDKAKELTVATVTGVQTRKSALVKVTFESGRTLRCTPDHLWLTSSHGGYYFKQGYTRDEYFVNPAVGKTLQRVIDPVGVAPDEHDAGWLGGIYDGEGHTYTIAQSHTANPAVSERIAKVLTALDIPFNKSSSGYTIIGGRQSYLKLLLWAKPTKHTAWLRTRILSKSFFRDDVVTSVESDGEGEVISLETSTGNYIAWGYASKNCIMGGYLNKQVMAFKNVPELHAHAQMWMKRRRKDEVLPQLPPKTFTDVLLDLPAWQRTAYNQVRNEMMLEISQDKTLSVATALARLTRLKQVAVSPQWTLKMEAKGKPVKVEALEDLLEERQDKRTLVFTKYAKVANGLADYLPTKFPKVKIFLLTGATPHDKRGQMEKDFQFLKDPDFAVWISTIDAGGMGLTLTSADTVVFMDKDWVPAKNDQAMDRAHRIGQAGNVNVISLIARDTVEEKVEGILDKKRALFNTIIEKDGGFYPEKITIEDIEDLFN